MDARSWALIVAAAFLLGSLATPGIGETVAPAVAPKRAEPFYPPTPPSAWQTYTEVSKLDDSTNVWISVESTSMFQQRFGGLGRARLTIRCMENTTSAMLSFGDQFMSDVQGFGQVTYRIDKQKARELSLLASTDHSQLGLWTGGSSIPFIKSLFAAKKLYVQATPFSEAPVEGDFKVAELEAVIKPLRKACNW